MKYKLSCEIVSKTKSTSQWNCEEVFVFHISSYKTLVWQNFFFDNLLLVLNTFLVCQHIMDGTEKAAANHVISQNIGIMIYISTKSVYPTMYLWYMIWFHHIFSEDDRISIYNLISQQLIGLLRPTFPLKTLKIFAIFAMSGGK